jgi:hypothetical protein
VIVELSDSSRADDLVRFLHAARCEAERDGTASTGVVKIVVTVPEAPSEQAARRELELYLAAWAARNPGVRARRKPVYDL